MKPETFDQARRRAQKAADANGRAVVLNEGPGGLAWGLWLADEVGDEQYDLWERRGRKVVRVEPRAR